MGNRQKTNGGIGNENEGRERKEKGDKVEWFRKRKRKGMGRWERRWKGWREEKEKKVEGGEE